MSHLVLLGDSILDNAAYIGNGPDVLAQVRESLPEGWRATSCAVDGSMTVDVARQVYLTPADATHLVVSVGGNDGIDASNIFTEGAANMAAALQRLAEVQEQFARNYEAMLADVLRRNLPTALCTIYYPRFTDAAFQRLACTALSLFNDAIIRTAFGYGLPLLDLRLLCSEVTDYANEIEPSVAGGAKIAAAIAKLVRQHDFAQQRTEVFS